MKLKLLLFSMLFSVMGWGQVVIDNTATGVSIPTGWSGINNVTAQTIQQSGYYLVQQASPNTDYLLSDIYSTINGADLVTINFQIATYGASTPTFLNVDMSLDGGVSWTSTATSVASVNSTTYLSTGVTFIGPIASSSVRFRFYDPVSGAPNVRIKSIVVNATFPSCTPPANPTGTITATQNCGNTSLTYSAPSASLYWQTSATGTSTANATTAPYIVSSNGTYYVRAFNGTCWSTGTVSQAVTVVNPITISSQPTSQSATTGNTATFSVTASNAAGYQWQVNTGSGWANIGGATSASYTTPAATLAMNGYQYQVIVTGNTPCGNVTSASAILSVTTGPCFTEDFASIGAGNSTSTAGSSTAWTGNANFPTVNTAYQAGGAVRIGSGTNPGSITSSALASVSGNVTVSVSVKGWTTVEGVLS